MEVDPRWCPSVPPVSQSGARRTRSWRGAGPASAGLIERALMSAQRTGLRGGVSRLRLRQQERLIPARSGAQKGKDPSPHRDDERPTSGRSLLRDSANWPSPRSEEDIHSECDFSNPKQEVVRPFLADKIADIDECVHNRQDHV